MTNAYVTVDTIKSASALDITGTGDDTRLRLIIEAVSRQIDANCNRAFYQLSASRMFDSQGGDSLLVPDLVSIDSNGVKTDDNKDRTFETTWAVSDYLTEPVNADPTGGHDAARPYTRLVVDTDSGSKTDWPQGRQTVQIAGAWGYWRRLRTATEVTSEELDASETDVDVDSQTDIEAGHTILVDSEQMYVESYSTNTLTVVRGVNGTTATTHNTSASISIFLYPAPVAEAALIQSARLWKRKDTAFESGPTRPSGFGLDLDVQALLSAHKRLGAAI
ncbi:MAG: hypothetical protein QF898_02825 [SAR202 cluster bacterium]|jgi:hypothetical protein|nr:hypothetical protein [SAR202 cluster bacterium]